MFAECSNEWMELNYDFLFSISLARSVDDERASNTIVTYFPQCFLLLLKYGNKKDRSLMKIVPMSYLMTLFHVIKSASVSGPSPSSLSRFTLEIKKNTISFLCFWAAISTTRPHDEIYSIPSLIFIVHLRPLCNVEMLSWDMDRERERSIKKYRHVANKVWGWSNNLLL